MPRTRGPSRVGTAAIAELDEQDLAALREIIANADREWADWNRLGMAFFAASGGSDAGFAAFDRFSRQSAKYDTAETQRRWEHYRRSPPDRLGPGTLVYEARQVDPTFQLPSTRHARAEPKADAAIDGGGGSGQDAAGWRHQLETFCHRASCAKGLLNTGEVLASVRDPRRWCAAALT